eukprot:scaffold173648_cov15-Tisochrysis_lutea.AAC.1
MKEREKRVASPSTMYEEVSETSLLPKVLDWLILSRSLCIRGNGKAPLAQRDYMVKQRATMTAPHTFTWGGRFKWQGPKHSTGLQHQV